MALSFAPQHPALIELRQAAEWMRHRLALANQRPQSLAMRANAIMAMNRYFDDLEQCLWLLHPEGFHDG